MADTTVDGTPLHFNFEETVRRYINTLKAKGISQYQLIRDYHISAGQLSRLRANQNVSTHTLNNLCKILSCRIDEIAIYVDEDN